MLATLAGVKRGVVRPSLPLAPVSATLPTATGALATAPPVPPADA